MFNLFSLKKKTGLSFVEAHASKNGYGQANVKSRRINGIKDYLEIDEDHPRYVVLWDHIEKVENVSTEELLTSKTGELRRLGILRRWKDPTIIS